MYINENLKRQKIIQKSVISGRRNTTGPKLPAAGLNRRIGIGGLTNFDLAALNITEQQLKDLLAEEAMAHI